MFGLPKIADAHTPTPSSSQMPLEIPIDLSLHLSQNSANWSRIIVRKIALRPNMLDMSIILDILFPSCLQLASSNLNCTSPALLLLESHCLALLCIC